MLELSSCEYSEYYYIDYLWLYNKNIEELSIEVDRGVNYNDLRYVLTAFTKLKTLTLVQNYADPENTLEDFIIFIQKLHYNFILEDEQSAFMSDLKIKDLKSNYKIHITYDKVIIHN